MVEPLRPALAVSVLVHGAVFALAVLLTVHRASGPATEAGASFSGDTFDLDEVLESQKRPASDPAPEPPAQAAAAAAPAPDPEAVPVRRPRRVRPKSPAPAASPAEPAPAAAAVGASASAPGGESAPGGNAGTRGEAAGVANVAKAFAKAMAAASHKDPTWDQLPLGSAGELRVVITIDDEGRIEQSQVSERDLRPAHLVKLVERTLLLMRAGRFALSKADAKSGSETLRIDVTLSAVDAQEDYEDPRHTVAMGFEPPRPDRPGRAYFVHAAGRRFDAKISIE